MGVIFPSFCLSSANLEEKESGSLYCYYYYCFLPGLYKEALLLWSKKVAASSVSVKYHA
jgi:hypothetical protein